MGLSSKQVFTGEGFGWAKNLTQAAGALEFPNMMLRTQQQQMTAPPLKCPRCESTNTKFCYYNNYNRSQPRHFCKACKRHWTKGGTLRNVPVGGGRKNKRLKTTNSISTNSNTNTTHAATASKNGIQYQQHVQQPQQDLPLEYNNDQKKFCEILYQSLLQPTSCLLPSSQSEYINNSFLASSTLSLDSMLPLPNPLMASSSSFDANFQLPNVSNYSYSDENGTSEDLTTTTATATATTMTTMPVQWQIPTSSAMDTPSNWNWEDLNTFISTDAEQLRDDSI